jgi:hypothetical protein
MTAQVQNSIAIKVRSLVRRHHVVYNATTNDQLAHHISRLSGDFVILDDIEKMLIALQRAGHLTRQEVVQYQAAYLHESRP